MCVNYDAMISHEFHMYFTSLEQSRKRWLHFNELSAVVISKHDAIIENCFHKQGYVNGRI